SRAPDTVRVGDPFHVLLRVAAPPGSHVDFPAGADSAAPVEVIDGPRQRTAAAPGGSVDVTADYTVVAWTTGAVPVALDSVTVRAGTVVRRVAMPSLDIYVRSVLPADSAQRTPKPARDPVADFGLWWLRYVLLALALLVLIAALVYAARRAMRRRVVRRAGEDAYTRALAGFAALDPRGLVALGEGGRHVALAVDVMRDYLVARFPGVAGASQTSGELVGALAAHGEVPADPLRAVLAAGDLVKFAAAPVRADDAARVATDARGIVEATETAVRARETQAAAEAVARARAESDERRAYEAEQRRRAAGAPREPDGDRTDRAA
ncbi:MAG TPA: hypothetical protein VGD56_06780, partial [Gemmatirosa sp.]